MSNSAPVPNRKDGEGMYVRGIKSREFVAVLAAKSLSRKSIAENSVG